MGTVTAIAAKRTPTPPTVSRAVERYLAAPQTNASRNTARAYASVLEKVKEYLGPRRPLAALEPEELAEMMSALWGSAAHSTWNRNLAVVSGWLAFCEESEWEVPKLPKTTKRKTEQRHEARAVDWHVIERLCTRRDVPLRDKVLYRMLYETSSRASAVLALNVDDLELQDRRAEITQKGGDRLQIAWGDKTAMILGRLVAGRTAGPVFLTDLKPGPRRASAAKTRDVDPETGRTRLSYGRARALIEQYTGGEITLHQLRHSSLTHLAEAGVGTTTLMAKSGHKNLRSLQRYARPSFAAVQAATELLSEPPRRR